MRTDSASSGWESREPPPHRLLDLKGQGNRHFWPDKVAVLHAWSRNGRSPGCCLSTGANDRPDYSNGREFTVISPELLRPAGWDCLRRAWQKRGYPVPYDNHSAPPPICTMGWRFTGANLNNPVAVRSQTRPTSSEQVFVVVMDASPGFFRRRRGLFILWRGLFILWRGLFILWRGLFILKGMTVQDHRGSVMVHFSHLELLHGVGRGGHRHDNAAPSSKGWWV